MGFDVAIIGGGPGGYNAALRASRLGLKTAVIEAASLGGTCLNAGCIPTKSMLKTAELKRMLGRSSEFGIKTTLNGIDMGLINSRSRSVMDGLRNGVTDLLSTSGVTVIEGWASFKDKNTLLIRTTNEEREITATNIVIATGATPRLLPGIEMLLQKELVWTSAEAIRPRFIPRKLLIIGSGAIGVELATFYSSFGSLVTIVEIGDRILLSEDREISDFVRKSFINRGMVVKLNTTTQNFIESEVSVSVELVDADGKAERNLFDIVIMAIGVSPNVSGLNLEKAGVNVLKNGSIEIFEYQETSQKGIYAIGDVAAAPWLAHKASREGIICAERIAGISELSRINLKTIPSCTYSEPQVASIGMTEEEARTGRDVKIGKAHFRGNGKAAIIGEIDGFVKVIFDARTGELLGAHLVGSCVTELISVFSVAIAGELTDRELMDAVFPHPTLSECLQEAVAAASSYHVVK
ncbi:MAG: dihydrolipoyl dehydrogenase [Holosporales bacterium]|jgi:dihydrolipoamide dehydrogenase|nr:dihydrolipoyl dehydrogenase [Holosporales bacterium]